jgi:outer membrane protein TolC
VREASAVARQRDHQSIDLRRAVDEAVTQAWEQLESAIATIGTRNDQIKAANLALDGVKQEQQYGSRTVLDVLDAEQELFGARTNLVRAQRDRIVAAYNLAFRLGQLTPQQLALNVEVYDPQVHADEVGWKTIGF